MFCTPESVILIAPLSISFSYWIELFWKTKLLLLLTRGTFSLFWLILGFEDGGLYSLIGRLLVI